MHSATIKATERPGAQAEEEAEQARVEAADAEKKAAIQRKEHAEGEMTDENGVVSSNNSNGIATSDELEDYKRLAEMRLEECDRWRNQIATMREENERIKHEMQETLNTRLVESPLYEELHKHFNEAKQQLERVQSVNERLETENGDLREGRTDFETTAKVSDCSGRIATRIAHVVVHPTQAEADAQVDGLRNAIKAHEADVARLRNQRDEASAELVEKKHKETVRCAQIDEMKALVQSKESRITALRSEARRLQLTLATKSNDAKLVDRLRAGAQREGMAHMEEDVAFIEVLQERLQSAEESSQDLRRQLDARSSSTSEQDLIAKVTALQSELDSLSSILKEATSDENPSPDDVKARLVGQSEEIRNLKRDLSSATESTTALCDELDKVGQAYNESQKVATERVVEAAKVEERTMRLTAEKSKADHKFFAAMRAKDAVENEKRAVLRNIERQAKVIEHYKEVEKAFQAQWKQAETELSHLRSLTNQQNGNILELQRNLASRDDRLADAVRAKGEADEASQRHNMALVDESRGRQEMREKCDKLQRELDRCKKQLASSGGAKRKGTGGDDVQNEYLNVSVTEAKLLFLFSKLTPRPIASHFFAARRARIAIETASSHAAFTPSARNVSKRASRPVSASALTAASASARAMCRPCTCNSTRPGPPCTFVLLPLCDISIMVQASVYA